MDANGKELHVWPCVQAPFPCKDVTGARREEMATEDSDALK